MKGLRKIFFTFSVALLIGIFTMSQVCYATGFVSDLRMSRTPETKAKGQIDKTFQVTSLPAAEAYTPSIRAEEISLLLRQIDREIEKPGSGQLPEIRVLADYHGEINLFLQYIADTISEKIGKKVELDHKIFPEKSIKEQLEGQGVDITQIDLVFHLLGDFLDRGPYGIKCFRAGEQLIDLGVAKYVTGNHDLWAFLNVMGFHLPIYDGYNFYGRTGAADLVDKHMAEHKRDAGWWTEKLAEYNKAQKELQDGTLKVGDKEIAIKDIRKELKELYLSIKDGLDEIERKQWEDLVGFYFGTTDVYTGFNAVGMMSAAWWGDKRDKINWVVDTAKAMEASRDQLEPWERLAAYVDAADKIVGQQLDKAREDGKWYWDVFDSINHQNYTSVEWWGKDWSSHKGWGTSVIDELNELEGTDKWNQSNYINNPHLKDLALFYRKNFTLYQKDPYGNYYTHGWLPVDMETGQISFTYKGVAYGGTDIWKGLEVIQNDIRDLDKPLSELHEALSLVNSWYADKTTAIKPEHIGRYVNEVGLEKIHKNIGVRTWFTCHNPLNKLHPKGVGFKVQQGEHVHFSVDKGMSWKKFKDAGAYVIVNAKGVILRGFDSPGFESIVDNPPAMKIEKKKVGDGYEVTQTWENVPLSREDFLRIAKLQLTEELDRLVVPAATSVPMLAERLKGVLEFSAEGDVKIIDEARLRLDVIDYLARECTLNENEDVRKSAQYIVREAGLQLGLKPASLHDFYMARNEGKWSNLTNPTFNIRAGVYSEARQIFRKVIDSNIGMFGFELARTETRYTGQMPGEYLAVCIAAGIKEGYRGPVFGIGDHYQVAKDKYFAGGEAREKEIVAIKSMISEAILGGNYNIDLDPSTLIDQEALEEILAFENSFVDAHLKEHPELLEGLDKPGIEALRYKLVDELELSTKDALYLDALYQKMHVTPTEVTMDLIRYIRGLEQELLDGKVTIGIGIEERHIDKKMPSSVRGSITLASNILKICKEEGLAPPCKIALQTGTMHGVGGKIDFGVFERHGKAADEIGIYIFVQHGTSTIKDREDFAKLPGAKVGEAHLATEYQKIHLGIIASMMPGLAEEMGKYMEGLMDGSAKYDEKFRKKWNNAFEHELQQDKTRLQILVEILSDTLPEPEPDKGKLKGTLKDLAKEISGPFKDNIWNVPADVQNAIDEALAEEFSFVMDSLGVSNTKDLVESIIPTKDMPEMHGKMPETLDLVLSRTVLHGGRNPGTIAKALQSLSYSRVHNLNPVFNKLQEEFLALNKKGALADELDGYLKISEKPGSGLNLKNVDLGIQMVLSTTGLNQVQSEQDIIVLPAFEITNHIEDMIDLHDFLVSPELIGKAVVIVTESDKEIKSITEKFRKDTGGAELERMAWLKNLNNLTDKNREDMALLFYQQGITIDCTLDKLGDRALADAIKRGI